MADKSNPWFPPDYTTAITSAFKAIAIHKSATPEQQEMALNWIINNLCKTHDMSYRPDSVRDSDFAEGKRFVGNQIIKQINLIIEDK